ncbi:MAG: hypothetical protein JO108_17755 [Acidobacteriaceae bacterium]|nr:hypothetical protein [Acidobacteriaceae bacterium]
MKKIQQIPSAGLRHVLSRPRRIENLSPRGKVDGNKEISSSASVAGSNDFAPSAKRVSKANTHVPLTACFALKQEVDNFAVECCRRVNAFILRTRELHPALRCDPLKSASLSIAGEELTLSRLAEIIFEGACWCHSVVDRLSQATDGLPETPIRISVAEKNKRRRPQTRRKKPKADEQLRLPLRIAPDA